MDLLDAIDFAHRLIGPDDEELMRAIGLIYDLAVDLLRNCSLA